MRLRIAVLTVFVAACAPAPGPNTAAPNIVGTFNFSMTGEETETTPPNFFSGPASGTGTLTVTAGKSTDYIVTIHQADVALCLLVADLDAKNEVVITPGQKCEFANALRHAVNTVTFTGGSVTVSEQEGVTVSLAYEYQNHLSFNISYGQPPVEIDYAGTGSRQYVGARY
ncbi:MAG: hypothetical protein QM817_27510 [Archangium sp.]